MRQIIVSIIIYFPIVFIYKVFGDPFNNYWINTYWFLVSIDFIFMFLGIRKVCSKLHLIHEHTIAIYKDVLLATSFYWGVMAVIRAYLYFNIERHSEVINSAGKITTGVVCIIIIFIYLSAKTWFRK